MRRSLPLTSWHWPISGKKMYGMDAMGSQDFESLKLKYPEYLRFV